MFLETFEVFFEGCQCVDYQWCVKCNSHQDVGCFFEVVRGDAFLCRFPLVLRPDQLLFLYIYSL